MYSSVTDYINKSLILDAIAIGVSFDEFWELSIADVRVIFKGFERRREYEDKQQKMRNYELALLTADFIWTLASGKQKIPSYEDIYERDTEEYKQKQIQKTVADLKRFAEKANEQRRRK